jgi:hypothetical protein
MQFDRQQWKCLAAMAATWMCAAGALQAQSLVVTAGTIIATDTDVAPGCGGATFGGSSALGSAPAVGASGNMVIRARITGTGVTPLNERALFFGSTRANLQLAIRSGDQAPGLAPGITIQTSFGTTGIDGTPRISENGTYYLFGTSLWNGGVVAANDTALYSGTLGSYSLLAREGDPAPGTAGATLTGTFSSTSAQSSGVNDSGTCFFKSTLAGGDVVGTTNNEAWFIGTPGSLNIVVRKGDTFDGGVHYLSTTTGTGFISQLNASGQFLHEETLSQTLGTNPATAADDKVLMLYTPGFGNQIILREGDAAPGTGGGTFSLPANTWTVNNGAMAFNSSGQTISRLDVTGGTTSSGVFIISASGVTPVAMLGDVAPGTGGLTFNVFNNVSCQINNAGQVAFQCTLAGAGVTAANDGAIFVGAPGSLQLAVREGDVVPGSGGTLTFDSMVSVSQSLNGLGQVVWAGRLLPTMIQATWSWDAGNGLREVYRSDETVEVQPGVFKTGNGTNPSSTGGFNNSNGTALNFSNDGMFCGTIGFLDNTRALFTVQVPHLPVPQSYCTAGTTTNGCNAIISATGQPSISFANPCVINTTGVEGNRSGITFYGLSASGVLWCPAGSSYLCVKAPTQRMTVQSTGGTDGLCDGALSDDWNAYQLSNPAALGNPWSAGDDIFVQAWFRDPPACKTTSLSNALKLTYQP